MKVKHLIESTDVHRVEERSLGCLKNKVYWIVVAFWLALNFIESPQVMRWWRFYNQPQLVTVYELIETLPCCIIGGIFMYMIPVGLTLAYRELCLKASFKTEELASSWMKPFNDFKQLITLTMLGAAIYAVFPPNIWGSVVEPTAVTHWSIFIPYASIAIVLVSAVLLPHYFFHRLFSKAKNDRLDEYETKISQISKTTHESISKRILLLLEREEVEKLKTWLIDVKILGEILIVALIHVTLVEIIARIIHS